MFPTKSPFALLTALLVAATAASAQTTVPATRDQVDRLIAVLKSEAPRKEKADACRLLALVGTKEAIPALASLLTNPELSHMARYGLEPIPDPAVDEALRAALSQVTGRQLAGVIDSLGVRRDAQAVDALAKRLTDADADVAQAAARALGSIGTPDAAKALEQALPAAPAAYHLALAEGLFRCAERLLAQGQYPPAAAIYDRIRTLEDAPHQVRSGALRGAILARQQDGLALLKSSLGSKDYRTFAAAVQTAQEMPGIRVTQALTDELGRLPDDRMILVIQTLGTRADETAIPALSAVARNSSPAVRTAAIEALPMIGDASAAPLLVELANDDDAEIAKTSRACLAAIPGKAVDSAVMDLLAKSNPDGQVAAIEIIGRRRMSGAVPALLKAAGGTEAKVRPAALKRAGELGTMDDLPRLLDLLARYENAADLEAAEQALSDVCAKSNDPEAPARTITARFNQAQPAQKTVLLNVLSTVGGNTALQTVRTTIQASDEKVRDSAIRALGAWKTADAAPDLLAIAKSAENPTVKMLSLRSYLGFARRPDLPARERLAMCRQAAGLVQRTDEKKMLLAALGSITSPQAVESMTSYLDDPATAEEASTAIVTVAEKLLNRKQATEVAPKLIEPLEKAAQATGNKTLAERAKTMAQEARNKAGKK